MESVSGYFRILFLLCCLFWISSNAERKSISKVVGSTVKLYCKNESLSTLGQVIWKKNETKLLSFVPPSLVHWYPEAYSPKINMSVSQDKLYALTIDRVQEAHAGNYTCETSTSSGYWEEKWMLVITEKEDTENKLALLIIIICGSAGLVLVPVVILTVILRHCKRHKENNIQPASGEMVNTVYQSQSLKKQNEAVYENCLESQHRRNQHIYSN